MGTISEKLTYLNETKSQLKTMISKGLETPLSNETFRQYVNALKQALINSMTSSDNITWSNLSKVTGTGTSITLNNTEKAPMRITLDSTNITQGTNPSPSNPQDIHTIKGNNVVNVCGKNLFHDYYSGSNTTRGITRTGGDGYVLLNGTYDKTANIDIFLTASTNSSGSANMTLLKANTTYTVRIIFDGEYTISLNDNLQISSRTLGGTFAWNYQGIPYSNNKWVKTFTVGNESLYLGGIRIPNIKTTDNVSFTNTKVYIQVEENSTDTEYEPYNNTSYPLTLGDLEYCKVGTTTNDEFIYNTTDTNLELNKWYLKKKVKKYVFDSADDCQNLDSTNKLMRLDTTKTTDVSSNAYPNSYCNRFAIVSSYTNLRNEDYGFALAGTNLYVRNVNITTLDGWKAWLPDNPLTFYIPLANPTYILVSDLLQMQLEKIYTETMARKVQTNISQTNADLSFIINAIALEG